MGELAGQRLGRFEIVRRLGAGAFGVVYEALDTEARNVVACKTLERLDPRALLRFKREFRMLADVSHPNLAPPLELLEQEGVWIVVLPLVRGGDLLEHVRGASASSASSAVRPKAGSTDETLGPLSDDETLQSDETLDTASAPAPAPASSAAPPSATSLLPLDEARLTDAFRQLVDGLLALHRHGLVHRDLKPSNVLVERSGRVRILDFGLVTDARTADGDVVGTPAYMAPEQVSGRAVDAAADFYAVGVMLFEALTGELPFSGAPLAVMVKKQTDEPPRPSHRIANVSPALDALAADLLARDPGKRPDGSEVLARLGRSSRPSVRTPAISQRPEVLVGRDGELRALARAFDEVRAGHARIVRVHGVSGAGKSALVARFLDEIADDADVLTGRCFEHESVPYRALDGAIDSLLPILRARAAPPPEGAAALATVFPVLGAIESWDQGVVGLPSPREARRAAARALGGFLSTLAAERPLVVHLDDVQWGDSDSAALLVEVWRHGASSRILWLLAHRSESADESVFLESLEAAGVLDQAVVLEVGPLGREAAEALALSILGRRDAESMAHARQIADEAAGHAMFVGELAHHARDSARPESLDAMLEERIASLGVDARSLLEIVAVAGAPIHRVTAERASGLAAESVEAARELRAARLLRVSGAEPQRKLVAYHDRVREASLRRLGDDERRARHLALAGTLEWSGGTEPEVLSHHFHAAGAHDRGLPHTALAAARASAALAFDRATALHRLIVEHTAPGDAARAERVAALGQSLVDAGRAAEAAEVFVSAARDAAGPGAVALRRRAVEQWLRSGHIDAGLEAVGEILDAVGLPRLESRAAALATYFAEGALIRVGRGPVLRPPPHDPAVLDRIDAGFEVGTALTLVDPLRGIALTRRASRLAFDTGEPRRVLRALVQEATTHTRRGSDTAERAHQALGRARELAATTAIPEAAIMLGVGETVVSFLTGRFADTERYGGRTEALLRAGPGFTWERETVTRMVLKAHYFTGALGRLAARTGPLVADAVDRGDRYAEVSLEIRAVYLTSLVRDEADQVTAALDRAIARWSGRKFFLQHFFEMVARVETAMYLGRGADAAAVVRERWAAIEKAQILRGQYVGVEGHHVRGRAALAAADVRQAEHAASAVDERRAPWARGLASALRAGARAASDPRESAILFARAEDELLSAGLRLFAASARVRRGQLTGGSEGDALVRDGLAAFEAEGARAPLRLVDVFVPVVRR